MSELQKIIERAKTLKKTIILPEVNDLRILKAASMATQDGIANIILIGKEEEIRKKASEDSSINLDNVKFLDHETYEKTNELIDMLYELRKEKGLTHEEAENFIRTNPLYFGNMLLKTDIADGMVAGAITATSDVLRPALQIIKTAPGNKLVSAFFLMEVPNCKYGENGTFIFADSGLNPTPNSEEIAEIAKESASSFKKLVEKDPKIAMLSFATKGSAKKEYVGQMYDAVMIAKERYPELELDGTLQLDAAIVPEVAALKAPDSKIAGHANVLIFPDLNSGNIAYKLVERLAGATAIGPITQGLAKPINDLSRGCKAEDVVGAIAITAIQSVKE